MASVGERLRNEREARNRTAAEIAAATGIDVAYLEALEGDDFHALPGKAFGKFYIRAYGEFLGFDPQPLIESYDLEAERLLREGAPKTPPRAETSPRPVAAALASWRETKQTERTAPRSPEGATRTSEEESARATEDEFDAGIEGQSVAVLVELADSETIEARGAPDSTSAGAQSHARGPVSTPLVALVVAGLVLGTWIVYSRFSATNPTAPSAIVPAEAQRIEPTPSRTSPTESQASRPESTPAPPSRSVKPDPVSESQLVVSEYGVGRQIVNRRLEGQGDRFESGQVVWFATRVSGASAGERIRHVWLHEGREVFRIDLELGGPDWRTHSRATVRPAGAWAAEARDREGHVLSRTTFAVDP